MTRNTVDACRREFVGSSYFGELLFGDPCVTTAATFACANCCAPIVLGQAIIKGGNAESLLRKCTAVPTQGLLKGDSPK